MVQDITIFSSRGYENNDTHKKHRSPIVKFIAELIPPAISTPHISILMG